MPRRQLCMISWSSGKIELRCRSWRRRIRVIFTFLVTNTLAKYLRARQIELKRMCRYYCIVNFVSRITKCCREFPKQGSIPTTYNYKFMTPFLINGKTSKICSPVCCVRVLRAILPNLTEVTLFLVKAGAEQVWPGTCCDCSILEPYFSSQKDIKKLVNSFS